MKGIVTTNGTQAVRQPVRYKANKFAKIVNTGTPQCVYAWKLVPTDKTPAESVINPH